MVLSFIENFRLPSPISTLDINKVGRYRDFYFKSLNLNLDSSTYKVNNYLSMASRLYKSDLCTLTLCNSSGAWFYSVLYKGCANDSKAVFKFPNSLYHYLLHTNISSYYHDNSACSNPLFKDHLVVQNKKYRNYLSIPILLNNIKIGFLEFYNENELLKPNIMQLANLKLISKMISTLFQSAKPVSSDLYRLHILLSMFPLIKEPLNSLVSEIQNLLNSGKSLRKDVPIYFQMDPKESINLRLKMREKKLKILENLNHFNFSIKYFIKLVENCLKVSSSLIQLKIPLSPPNKSLDLNSFYEHSMKTIKTICTSNSPSFLNSIQQYKDNYNDGLLIDDNVDGSNLFSTSFSEFDFKNFFDNKLANNICDSINSLSSESLTIENVLSTESTSIPILPQSISIQFPVLWVILHTIIFNESKNWNNLDFSISSQNTFLPCFNESHNLYSKNILPSPNLNFDDNENEVTRSKPSYFVLTLLFSNQISSNFKNNIEWSTDSNKFYKYFSPTIQSKIHHNTLWAQFLFSKLMTNFNWKIKSNIYNQNQKLIEIYIPTVKSQKLDESSNIPIIYPESRNNIHTRSRLLSDDIFINYSNNNEKIKNIHEPVPNLKNIQADPIFHSFKDSELDIDTSTFSNTFSNYSNALALASAPGFLSNYPKVSYPNVQSTYTDSVMTSNSSTLSINHATEINSSIVLKPIQKAKKKGFFNQILSNVLGLFKKVDTSIHPSI